MEATYNSYWYVYSVSPMLGALCHIFLKYIPMSQACCILLFSLPLIHPLLWIFELDQPQVILEHSLIWLTVEWWHGRAGRGDKNAVYSFMNIHPCSEEYLPLSCRLCITSVLQPWLICMFTWSPGYQHQTVHLHWREGSWEMNQHPVAASLSQVQDPSYLTFVMHFLH